MAHSSHFRALQQLLRQLLRAEAAGLPLEELAARELETLSRRRFLRAAGLSAGAALVGGTVDGLFPRVARATAGSRIAIVGGGIAGLNAALTLADAGVFSTVYEADVRIGGRMHSNRTDWANGQVSEWCGELVGGLDDTLQALCARFGLSLEDRLESQPTGSTATLFLDGAYVSFAEVAAPLLAMLAAVKRQARVTGTHVTYNTVNAAARRLDALSMYDWIERHVPGGHAEPAGRLVDLGFRSEFGIETPRLSALNSVWLVAGDTSLVRSISQEETSEAAFHIAGGNESLPEAMARALPSGTVQLEHRLLKVRTTSAGAVELTFSTPGGSLVVEADHAILALPFAVLRTLDIASAGFDALKLQAIQELGYGSNSKLAVQFSTRYWTQRGDWGVSTGESATDLDFQTTWDGTAGQAGTTGILVDYTGGDYASSFTPSQPYTSNGEALVYAESFLDELEFMWPGAWATYNGRATLSCPGRDPNRGGSYSGYLVNQISTFAGYEGVRQGNIHFAGEHCSLTAQGYMEGGAEEGARAAQEVLADLGAGVRLRR